MQVDISLRDVLHALEGQFGEVTFTGKPYLQNFITMLYADLHTSTPDVIVCLDGNMQHRQCQGTSETGNISHPSAHRAPTDLQNRHSRGWVPAECLEQKMLYVYTTICTQGDFTLSRK